MATFSKLIRSSLRRLATGKRISEHGIEYTKLAGDGRWSINVMVARVRHHVVIGLESQGYTRTQAEELIAQLKAKKHEASHGVKSPKSVRSLSIADAVTDYLTYLEKHGGKDIDAKRRRFSQHVLPHLGRLRVATLSDDDWRRYVAARRAEGAASGTINRERSAMLHMLNTARRRKVIAAVPCELPREPEPPGKLVYLTPSQARALLEAAANDQSRHARPFVMIAMYTGMRQAPILRLRVRDVDVDRRILWVADDKAGRREQAMPRVLAEYLAAFTAGMEPEAFLFASPKAESGHVYQANSIFDRCVERAGLSRDVTPHTLRHTAATNAAHAGVDAATIQAMGGWKTRQMVERYTHAASVSQAMEALEKRLMASQRDTS